jgi:hypothetical protein
MNGCMNEWMDGDLVHADQHFQMEHILHTFLSRKTNEKGMEGL